MYLANVHKKFLEQYTLDVQLDTHNNSYLYIFYSLYFHLKFAAVCLMPVQTSLI